MLTWQYPLAWIAVPSGAATLSSTAVQRRGYWLGPDGQIITSTTSVRPAADRGRLVYEYESGTLYMGDGSAWRTVSGDSDWLPFSAATGWTIPSNGYGAKIRNKNGQVTMVLEVQRNGSDLTASTVSAVATLPAGFAPSGAAGSFGVPITLSVGGIVAGFGRVKSDGKVYVSNYQTTINDGENVIFTGASWPV